MPRRLPRRSAKGAEPPAANADSGADAMSGLRARGDPAQGFGRRRLLVGALALLAAPIAGGRRAAAAAAPCRETGNETGSAEPASDPAWPFDRPPLAALRASPRKVLAHWHRFPLSFDNLPADADTYAREMLRPEGEQGRHAAGGGMMRERPLPRPPLASGDWRLQDMATEVKRAAAIGLDGFMFNILSPPPSPLWDNLLHLLKAARLVDPGFRIALMIDAAANDADGMQQIAAAIAKIAADPALFRSGDGRLVLSAFSAERQPAAWWAALLAGLRQNGAGPFFVPVLQGWRRYAAEFAAISDGLSDWGVRTAPGAASLQDAATLAHAMGRIWMAPVAPQMFRPKNLFYAEAGNSASFSAQWQAAIDGGADWVHLITWNDYGEGTEIAPSTGIQYAFYDLAAFYISWFKTGQPPAITRDVLYYLHRLHRSDAMFDPNRQPRPFERRQDGDVRDEIELLAFLTAPGELEIEVAGDRWRQPVAAGITSLRAPLRPGRPRFSLYRGGQEVIRLHSAFTVRERTGFQDFLYRAGSSSRPAVAGTASD
jgi:hypothetical protein